VEENFAIFDFELSDETIIQSITEPIDTSTRA
jgi:hypothetical protein